MEELIRWTTEVNKLLIPLKMSKVEFVVGENGEK